MSEKKNESLAFHFYQLLAFALLASPQLFLEKQSLCGCCMALGYIFFIAAFHKATKTRQFFSALLFLWLALSLRYYSLFGYKLSSLMLVAVSFSPMALILALFFALSRLFRKLSVLADLILSASGYTLAVFLIEYFGLSNIPNFTTYSFLLPAISQNYLLLNEFGMAFVLFFILTVAAELLCAEGLGKKCAALVLVLALLSALRFSGSLLLSKATEPDYTLRVALGLHEKMDFLGNTEREYSKEERMEIFRRSVEAAAAHGAELLVLNEEFVTMDYRDEEELLAYYSSVIRENGVPTLVCFDESMGEGERSKNWCIFYDADGTELNRYTKSVLVPFVESGSYVTGDGTPGFYRCTLGGHDVKLCSIICFDLDDETFLRRIPKDCELVLAPSWDWDTVNLEQRRSVVRAIEFNTTILKHTYSGFSFSAGPYGLWGEELDNREVYETVRMIEVPIWEKEDS